MRPIIAITPQLELDCDSYLSRRRYADLIERQCGGAAIVITPSTDEDALESILAACDGLLVAGGSDVQPCCYGCAALEGCDAPQPDRDDLEMRLVRIAKRIHMPFLGVCRGMQLVNVAFGGTLHQRIEDNVSPLEHWQPEPYDVPSHTILVEPHNPIADTLGARAVQVNSMHHQAVDTVGTIFNVAARDPHGLIEAVYAPDEEFFVGVQWHPEYAPQLDESIALGRAFVKACSRFHTRKERDRRGGTANHLYTTEYLLETQRLDPHGEDRRRIWEYLDSSTSKYDGITVYSSALPRLFDQSTYSAFKDVAETTYRILTKVVDAYISDPAYRSVFDYDPRYEELILLPSGYDEPLPMMRVDIFFNEDTLAAAFCEFNSDGSSGMNENREITIGVQAGAPYRAFAQHHRLQDCNESLFAGWIDEFLRIYHSSEHALETPAIAIVDFLDHSVVEEFKIYKKLFEKRGYTCAIYDVRELAFDGEHLRGGHAYSGPDDMIIHAAWRRCISTDVVHHWNESQPLIEAVRQQKVVLIGSFAGHIVHDKRIFQILLKPETKRLLTTAENQFLERMIPETIILKSDSADLKRIKETRPDWVIKPNDSYGSQQVHIGLDCSDQEWADLVDRCASHPDGQLFLAQRFCNPFPTPALPLYGNESDYSKPPQVLKNLSGLYVYGGRFAGVFSRQGPQNIILGRKGGVTAPSIWVDIDEDVYGRKRT